MSSRTCQRSSYLPCARQAAIAVSLAVLIFAVSVGAQNINGRVLGIVTDPQGAAVAGAKVAVANTGTNVNWNTVTDGRGSFQVLDVPIGMYTITVESRGFARARIEPQELTINQALRVDVSLKLGAANETVEVQSRAAQVETVNPTIGGTVTGKAIQICTRSERRGRFDPKNRRLRVRRVEPAMAEIALKPETIAVLPHMTLDFIKPYLDRSLQHLKKVFPLMHVRTIASSTGRDSNQYGC